MLPYGLGCTRWQSGFHPMLTLEHPAGRSKGRPVSYSDDSKSAGIRL